jgi:hypothetical protein
MGRDKEYASYPATAAGEKDQEVSMEPPEKHRATTGAGVFKKFTTHCPGLHYVLVVL